MAFFKGVPEGTNAGKSFAYVIVQVVLQVAMSVLTIIALALALSGKCVGSECDTAVGMVMASIFGCILHIAAAVVGFMWLLTAKCCHGTGEGCCGTCCGGCWACCDNGPRAMVGLTTTTFMLNLIGVAVGAIGLSYHDGVVTGAWVLVFLVFLANVAALVVSIVHNCRIRQEEDKTGQGAQGQSLGYPVALPVVQLQLQQIPPQVPTMQVLQATPVVATAVVPASAHVAVPVASMTQV